MVAESWFRSLWKTPTKQAGPQKAVIGILAFEVASLMTKVVHMWQSLSDKQIAKLREEIENSLGIRKLVSDDDNFIGGLICAEMVENLEHVAKSLARLASKCSDPSLKAFEHVFEDLILFGVDPHGWSFTHRKMDGKVKKMGRFVSVNSSLYQEMEALADLEQTVRRMKCNGGDSNSLIEFEKKVAWKKHEVRALQEASLWKRTYDYTVHLLARSTFTIFIRIKNIFGIQQMVDGEVRDSRVLNSHFINSSKSVSALMESRVNVNPSENGLSRFSSGPVQMFTAKSGPMLSTHRPNNFYSGPLSGRKKSENFFSGPLSGRKKSGNFFSGPLERSTAKSGQLSAAQKTSKKIWRTFDQIITFHGKKPHSKPNGLTQVGPFQGCMMADSGILNGTKDADAGQLVRGNTITPSFVSSKRGLLNSPPGTLGAAALALHYANVIIVIEKLAASPHLIGHDARDDLYNMLPASLRTSLRAQLKPYSKSLAAAVHDTALAGEWSEAIARILEWLAPLAHNMIRWQSERSFEQQNIGSRNNVLLVQTLFFASQEKTEAAITELLVGLNYIWRFDRELNAKALLECASNGMFGEYMDMDR